MAKQRSVFKMSGAVFALFGIFFISGFTALFYQVVWQRLLGLFSGSDVRSVTIVVASYLLGLGLDRYRVNHQREQTQIARSVAQNFLDA